MAVNLSTLSSTMDRGTPTNAGDYYTSMTVWEAAAQTNHIVGTQSILECYKGTTVENGWIAGGALEDEVVLPEWPNATATDNITVRAASGEGNGGVIGEGFTMQGTGTSYRTILDITGYFVNVEGFSFNVEGASQIVAGLFLVIPGSSGCSIKDLIFTSSSSSTNSSLRAIRVQTSDLTVENILIRGFAKGFVGLDWGSNVTVTNLTTIDCNTVGIEYPNRVQFNNSLDYGSVTGWSQASGNSTNQPNTNNASGDGTHIGTAGQTISDVDFDDYAGGDYHPKTGGLLQGTGTSPPLTQFDISGAARNDPDDIGAYAASGVGPVDPILVNATQTDITQTSATIGCTTDTAGGTLYWYVSTSATPPSAADLKAGTGAVDSGNLVPQSGPNTAGATGLTANTQYWHHWIQEVA